ncbi:hypothetical protein PPERSA_00383 [Pseudocohnilembus persalinus]|uniref:Transmembrane protein n=1 Tax=Pseudocohnilembus persalinus TaxID=266149 RepID=A0A0V0QYS4_PSEPJ|nr:hypothetical protein PPERSA_00383 [Pseudocohnilembus persalinus]|eukprot:KRX07226.1 hypothetical protein PPERSA_00383 [Pseudocohnilembus persalinus]
MKNKETVKGNLPYKDNKFESGQGAIQPENGQNSQKQQQQDKFNNKVIEQQQQSKKNKDSLNEEEINYEDGQKTSTDPQIYTTLDYYQNSSTKENCSGDNDDCTKPLYGHQGIPQQNEEKNWPYNQQQQQQLQQQQQENKNLMHDYNYNYNNNTVNNKGVVNSTFNQLPSLGVFNNSSNNNQYEDNGFHSSGNLMGIPNNYQQNGDNQINFTFQDDFFKDMGDKNYDVKIEPSFEDPNQIQGIKNLNQINSNGNGRSFTFNGNGGNGNTNHYYNPSQLQSTNSNDMQNAYTMDDFNQQQQYQQPQQQQNGYLNQNNLLQNQNPLFMQYNLNEPQQINNNGNQMNNNNTNNHNNFFNQQQQLFYHNNNKQLQQQQQQVQQQQHQQQQNQQEQRKKQKQDQLQSQKKQQSTETSSPTGNTTYNINTSSNETYQQQQKQQQKQQYKKQKNKGNEDIIQEKFKEEYRTGSDQGLGYGSEGGELSEEQESKLIKKKIRKEKGYHKEYQKIDHNRQSCPSEYCRKFREKGVNTQSDKCPVYQQKLRSQKQQNSQRQRDDEKSYMAKFVIYTKALVNKLRRQGVDVDGEKEVQELQEMGDNIVQRKKYQETVEKEKQNYIRIHGPQNLMNIAQFFLLMFVLAIGINSVVYVGVFQAAQYPIRINNRNLEEKDPKIGKYLNNYYFCRCYSKECSELDYLQVSQQNTDKEMNQNQYVQKQDFQDSQENCEQKNDEKSQGIFYDNNKTHETCQKQKQEEQNSSSKFELQGLNTCALIKIQKKNNINSKIYKMKNNLQETKKLWSQKKQDKKKQKEK